MYIYYILALVVILWILGGQWKGRIRDLGVPIVMGLALIFLLKGDWLYRIIVGMLTCATANTIRIGYGNFMPGEKNSFLGNLLKDRNGWWIRALWGFIVSLVVCLPLMLTHYLMINKCLAYVGGNTLMNYLVSRLRLPCLLADIFISLGIGSLLFLI